MSTLYIIYSKTENVDITFKKWDENLYEMGRWLYL